MHDSVDSLLAPDAAEDEVTIVATPPWLHAPQALAALRRGRHVLCEKPLAITLDEARSLDAAARSAGRVLACCSARFSTRALLRNVRALLDRGDIGANWRVHWRSRAAGSRAGIEYQPTSRWFLDRARSGGGSLLDWGGYDVAVWVELFRPIAVTVESAWFGYPQRGPALPPDVKCDVEHQAVATLRLHLADGKSVPVQFERSAACFGATGDLFQIEGDRGALEWDWLDWQGDAIRVHGADPDGKSTITHHTLPHPDQPGCHARPLHELAALLRGEPNTALTGARAVQCYAVIAAIQAAATTQQPQTVAFTS